ncbi:MAG: acryloyl-CoA reductase [Rhodothermales bacterium]|nr:acryloyl-CoA reductase [Rhodothermales bacterium]
MGTALFVEEKGSDPSVALREVSAAELPEGDVLVSVEWSSLNYKDALALTGRSPIIRGAFPFIPGIDLAGVVLESKDPRFASGDRVLQTGWGLGETRFGGYATLARLKSEHLVAVPDALSNRDAMIIGTAGFTAMLACQALLDVGTADGPVVVTGASGGVGSFSIALLKRLGFEVVASTGSGDPGYLERLGARDIITRQELGQGATRPLDSARWGGAVDSVGGPTLEALISQVGVRGSIAACGLAGGSSIATTVFPFILRGVSLLGIDSNTCPTDLRVAAWGRLAALADRDLLDLLVTETDLAGLRDEASRLLAGKKRGRTVVKCQA